MLNQTATANNDYRAPDRFEPPEALIHLFRAAVVAATVALYAGAYTSAQPADSSIIADASAAMASDSAPTSIE